MSDTTIGSRLTLIQQHNDDPFVDIADPRQRRLAQLAHSLVSIPYSPSTPHPKQKLFLLDFSHEVLFGGAAGGGKSIGILMAALQFIEVPGYAAIIFRKSYSDLAQPGALMDRADEWLRGKAHWDAATHTWTFPSRATLTFGYLDRKDDRLKYQGAEYQFIGFDELTHIKERDYRYLFSRLRRPIDAHPDLARIPLRMRATTNPGGPGHEWVYRRFIKAWEEWKQRKGPKPTRTFLPSLLADNPSLDYEEYERSLFELDPVTREQLLRGDWSIRPDGRMFKRAWWKMVDASSVPNGPTVRYWDLAATDDEPGGDPDWTAGAKVRRDARGRWWLLDMVRFRSDPAVVEARIRQTAITDGRGVTVYIEQEPGASGKSMVSVYRRTVLPEFTVYGNPTTQNKVLRATPVAARAGAGDFFMVAGGWNEDWLNECEIFPDGEHDDQVDAVSGTYQVLARMPLLTAMPTGTTQDNPWDLERVGEKTVVGSESEVAAERLARDMVTRVGVGMGGEEPRAMEVGMAVGIAVGMAEQERSAAEAEAEKVEREARVAAVRSAWSMS